MDSAPFVGIALAEILFFGFISLIGLGLFVLWLLVLIDCIKNEPSEGNDKIVWVLVIVLTHWIGALIYLLVRKPQRKARYGV